MRTANVIQAAAIAAVIAATTMTAAGPAQAAVGRRLELHTLRNANPLPRTLINLGRTFTGAAHRYWEETNRTIDVLRARAAR